MEQCSKQCYHREATSPNRGQIHLKRAMITVFFCLLAGVAASLGPGTLEQSKQNITLTGIGANASGDGTMQVTWGDCSYDGTSTNCTVSGAFTGLGPGGTYNFVLSYPGNGPSPLTAITQSPGSDFITFALSKGSLTYTFNESNGTSLSFHNLNYSIFFVPGITTCTGNPLGVRTRGGGTNSRRDR